MQLRKKIWLVLAVATVFRVLLLLRAASHPQVMFDGDSQEYLALAQGLIRSGEFEAPTERPLPPGSVRTPVYPFFLTPFLRLFGETPKSYLAVAAVQSMLSILNVWMLYRFARKTGASNRIACTAAAFLAIDPMSALYGITIMSETLFTSILLLLLLLFAGLSARPTLQRLLATAGLTAMLILTRPIAQFLPLLLAMLILLFANAVKPSRWLYGSFFVVLCFLLVLPWIFRNQRRYDFSGISTVQGFNLLYYNAATAMARAHALPVDTAEDYLTRDLATNFLPAHPSVGDRVRAMQTLAGRVIFSHPATYLTLHAQGMIALLLDPGRINIERFLYGRPDAGGLLAQISQYGLTAGAKQILQKQPVFLALFLIILLWNIILTLGMISGLVFAKRTISSRYFWLAIGIIFYFLVLTGPIGAARFRIPITPLISYFAAFGLSPLGALLANSFSSTPPATSGISPEPHS